MLYNSCLSVIKKYINYIKYMHKLFPLLSLGVDFSRNLWAKRLFPGEFLNILLLSEIMRFHNFVF